MVPVTFKGTQLPAQMWFTRKNTFHLAFIICMATLIYSCKKNSSGNSTFEITSKYELAPTCSEIFLTSKHDNQGKPYLYVAAKEGGLKIYEIGATPVLVKSISISNFASLHVMNLSQQGDYLYLALGNHLGLNIQSPGFAIIDVSNPSSATVKSYWRNVALSGGTGIIETEGNYAYLGAMKNGLLIFDVTDKSAPILKSAFIPSIVFPDTNPDPNKYNARGMAVKNDLVYMCYDAGGLRIINAMDKLNPRETGRFSNPGLNGKPRAYNNIVLDGTIVYAAVDFCGMEVINVSDTSSIRLMSWWNPWNCQVNPFNWFTSNGHANEIVWHATRKMAFISSGKSDLQVMDVSNPASPGFKYEYGGINNNIGTWGVSIYKNNIYLSYICSTIPFSSNWTGIKILQYK